jgi:hypothetical protein
MMFGSVKRWLAVQSTAEMANELLRHAPGETTGPRLAAVGVVVYWWAFMWLERGLPERVLRRAFRHRTEEIGRGFRAMVHQLAVQLEPHRERILVDIAQAIERGENLRALAHGPLLDLESEVAASLNVGVSDETQACSNGSRPSLSEPLGKLS